MKKEEKRKTPQNCKSPVERQRFITTIKNVTGYTDIHEKKVKVKVTQSLFATPWNSPGQNPGVVSCSLLQGIFPTQGLNPGLPHCKQILYHLSHKGSPRTLDQVSYPFSRGSSRPRNRTGVSCIAGRFFTN